MDSRFGPLTDLSLGLSVNFNSQFLHMRSAEGFLLNPLNLHITYYV